MALFRAVMSNILMQNDNGYQMQMRLTANCNIWHDSCHLICRNALAVAVLHDWKQMFPVFTHR